MYVRRRSKVRWKSTFRRSKKVIRVRAAHRVPATAEVSNSMNDSLFNRGPERRKQPRGGRRATDVAGFAPLVLVLGRGEDAVAQAEAVLARLKFAVTTTGTVEEALRILEGIR